MCECVHVYCVHRNVYRVFLPEHHKSWQRNQLGIFVLRHMLKVALCMKFNFARNLSTNFNINFSYLLNSLEDTFSCIWLFCWQHDFFNDHGNRKNLSLTRCLLPKFLFSFVIFSNTTTKICKVCLFKEHTFLQFSSFFFFQQISVSTLEISKGTLDLFCAGWNNLDIF